MTNVYSMAPALDREKNLKASMYTGVVCAVVFIVFFFAKWTLPAIPLPPVDEGIEINLGNSDEGLGDIAPQVPGDPTDADETSYSPPATSQPIQADAQPITPYESETDEAVNTVPKKIVRDPIVRKTETAKPKPTTQPVAINPTPAPPRPKAVYKGGTSAGTGGNNADTYNGVRNQGVAGGNGDQGRSDGNPNSDSYKGNGGSGNSGVRIRSGLGGRRFTRLPSFEDDFNENAKVAVNIKVDQTGKVTSASVNLSGTTTTNAGIRAIAVRKALQLKLNAASDEEQVGTIVFDFRLKG